MFVQIHMLQSMPPGNLNRDETGQPKKCIFGGVTRGRISSQCLKRNIRHSPQFKEAFGDALADRTTYLPRMIADELKVAKFPEEELAPLMLAVTKRFKKEKKSEDSDSDGEEASTNSQAGKPSVELVEQTGQLVFFQQPYLMAVAQIIAGFRKKESKAYQHFIGTLKPKPKDADKKALDKKLDELVAEIAKASKSLTVDIGLFGRMTTSDLVVNVEAACQVAHAIGTHEAIIESDYFTAMDDSKAKYATKQTEMAGAAFLGSGDTETFFNASVYYKYLNVDLGALGRHLNWNEKSDASKVAGVLISAAALSNPTGKQNSFASHGRPELILVEVSESKLPISYANAFLQPVEGPNFLASSAAALKAYVESIATAYAPKDVKCYLLAVGHAKTAINGAKPATSLTELLKLVEDDVIGRKSA